MKKFLMLLICVFSLSSLVQAEEKPENSSTATIDRVLAMLFPGTKPDSVGESVMPGMYEVVYGAQVAYVSDDGRFVIRGDILDLKQGKNISEDSRRNARLNVLAGLDEKDMIVFSPEKPKHTISVFTDIDCGYCRKLHQNMSKYNEFGIKVRYLSYPRAGIDTPSYKKAVSVWCSEDRKKAITEAKGGKAIPSSECKDPVKQHIAAAEKIGLQGTPLIILDDGKMYPGFVPPDKLIHLLEQK
ncbi:MAG: thioredoxin fold domain-containing protein [Gammaproteobacteria bacterium]|nr:thioredoxin fold domain-containing protein [Gammaproteobacteria bacterium]MDH5592993.1 thioredoxin fold domain-containing protein [Gammaproteobacteria bacterium]